MESWLIPCRLGTGESSDNFSGAICRRVTGKGGEFVLVHHGNDCARSLWRSGIAFLSLGCDDGRDAKGYLTKLWEIKRE